MKLFYSIFSILLGILCMLILFLYPRQDSCLLHNFTAKALAKEITSGNHQTLSDAQIFSLNKTYQMKLPAYESFYGCISSEKQIRITVTSSEIQKLKITLLTDTGKKLSCQTSFTQKTYTLSPSQSSLKEFTRIFLCITSQSPSGCSLSLQVEKTIAKNNLTGKKKTPEQKQAPAIPKAESKNPSAKPKSSNSKSSNPTQLEPDKNNTTSNPDKNNATSNPNTNVPVYKQQKPVLCPQFLTLVPGSTHKLSIKSNHQVCNFSDFTLISSNPSVASVKNGKVFAHKEGTAILYICSKKNSAMTSSCFLRILARFC